MDRCEYRVEWSIEVDATSPFDAAQQCWEIIRDPESIASVFVVTKTRTGMGERYRIDVLKDAVDASYLCDTCGRVGNEDDGISGDSTECPDEDCPGTVHIIVTKEA